MLSNYCLALVVTVNNDLIKTLITYLPEKVNGLVESIFLGEFFRTLVQMAAMVSDFKIAAIKQFGFITNLLSEC